MVSHSELQEYNMLRVVGLNEKEVTSAESFTKALRFLYDRCIEPIARGEKHQNSETTCYIGAIGKTAAVRMYYPYVFEFAIKAGLIKDGILVEGQFGLWGIMIRITNQNDCYSNIKLLIRY